MQVALLLGHRHCERAQAVDDLVEPTLVLDGPRECRLEAVHRLQRAIAVDATGGIRRIASRAVVVRHGVHTDRTGQSAVSLTTMRRP